MTNYLNKICPVCGGNILLTALGQMCEQCHYVLPTTNSASTTMSKRCPDCDALMVYNKIMNGWECGACDYKEYLSIGDLPTDHTPRVTIGYITTDKPRYAVSAGQTKHCTIVIGNCKELKLEVNSIAVTIDFEQVDLNKYEAIEINGHRFERVVDKK